jgi:hypothetical protein
MNILKFRRTRQLLAATLAIGSILQWATPVWADGTAAGTPITNTATGTFTDDNNTPYQTTSNEVKITIAEVAGIDVTVKTLSAANPNAGDTLYVDFLIANTGNDHTQFFVPGTATLSNTTAFAQNGDLQIVAVDGVDIAPVTVPNAGATTGALGLSNGGSIAPNPGTGTGGTITVRVPIRVLPTAPSGATLTVSLGNTATPNTSGDRATDPDSNDVYTVDNPTAINGETNTTPPSNGVREGMATTGPTSITVNARLQAFAAVLKAVSGYSNNNTPNNLSDDQLNYNLALRVENPSSPPAGLVAAELHGTQLNVNGSNATSYVLVSDAVPTGMQVSATVDPVAPAGWQVVYSQTPLTTNALNAVWDTTKPTTGSPITRVGFITATPVPKGTVGVGTTVSGFTIALTPTAGFTGGQIANIAQVFGQSQSGATVPGTSTQIVYDESGDQTTNNGLNGNDPGTTAIANGGITTGQADPAVDGTDTGTGNNATDTTTTNQGSDTGPNAGTKAFGGEVILFTIAATPLNGPNGQPGAVGPNNNNDDFTNKSIRITEKLAPDAVLTDAQTPDVIFTNTVQNTSGGTQAIAIRPTPPATPTALPDNTKVKITDPVTGNAVTYNYTAADGFKYESGTPGTSESTPVKLSVPGGNGTANYTVTINLPGGMTQFQNYPVTITAFIDSDTNGQPTGEPSNQTINRVYTNYVRLDKKARILESNGTPVAGAAGSYTDNQIDLGAAATPGRVIEYQITYTNISSTQGTNGSNNVTLSAKNLVITENGSAGTNTWGAATFDPDYPTSAVGSAKDLGGGITVTTGGSPVDIQEYQDKIDTLLPGASGIFTFQRKIK